MATCCLAAASRAKARSLATGPKNPGAVLAKQHVGKRFQLHFLNQREARRGPAPVALTAALEVSLQPVAIAANIIGPVFGSAGLRIFWNPSIAQGAASLVQDVILPAESYQLELLRASLAQRECHGRRMYGGAIGAQPKRLYTLSGWEEVGNALQTCHCGSGKRIARLDWFVLRGSRLESVPDARLPCTGGL